MTCKDYGDDHCCWINGKVCSYLEEHTVEGRRWACGLFRKLGSWEKVYETEEYKRDIKPLMDRIGCQCGEYPGDGICAVCDG